MAFFRAAGMQQGSSLFEDLIGTREERRRHFEAKGLGGLEVDRELEPSRVLYRKIGRLLALQDAVDI
jgi:hypothetical protein